MRSEASKHSMRCPEFEKLSEDYQKACRDWRDAVGTPAVSVDAAGLRREATMLKEATSERALEHRRKCLLCANINNGQQVDAMLRH
jgi:hypothetical protein